MQIMQCSAVVIVHVSVYGQARYMPQINYLGCNVPLLSDVLTSCLNCMQDAVYNLLIKMHHCNHSETKQRTLILI